MKSEFYREVSQEHKTRKSTAKQRQRKDFSHLDQANPTRIVKGLKSAPRGQIHSIDISKKHRIEHQQPMLRISFSRPLILEGESLQMQKSTPNLCCECESLKLLHQKQLKQLRMYLEQEITTKAEKYIQMERKYLLKENENINLSSDHISLLHSYGELEDKLKESLIEGEDLKEKCFNYEEEIVRLLEDIKKYQDQNKFFNHFLSVFVEQTRCMINWCKLFEKTCDQLPSFISQVRQDLFCRKVDLDLILKESISYKNANFGNQTIKELDNSSCFFGSEEDDSSSFMKYFKQDNYEAKSKVSRLFPLTEIKERSCDIDMFSVNKQNLDTANRPSFEFLIHSRLNDKLSKHKTQKMNDDFFRILLAQAQTIQSSNEVRCSSRKSNSHCDINVSLFSSIARQVDFDIY